MDPWGPPLWSLIAVTLLLFLAALMIGWALGSLI